MLNRDRDNRKSDAAVARRYRARIAAGELESDAGQAEAVRELVRLERELAAARRPRSILARLVGRKAAPRGLYLYGDVGRGKTMLMDLFFEAVPVERKRRVHFHEFMAEVHERIFELRQAAKRNGDGGGDAVMQTAAAIAQETDLLCFDEFHVTDIADAMILGRLFTRLFAEGVVVLATSNVPPAELYKGGLNRALFLPFIDLLEARLKPLKVAGRTDFRLEKLAGVAAWHVPADARAKRALDVTWAKLAGGSGAPAELALKGRSVPVPRAGNGAARFAFADLCVAPLGALDFLRIAHAFHTLVIDDIPQIGAEQRNEAKRFILLIDTLYDNAVKLIASAEAEPDALYLGVDGFEAAEFRRTASRLIEMRSAGYLALAHGRRDSAASGDTTGLIDT